MFDGLFDAANGDWLGWSVVIMLVGALAGSLAVAAKNRRWRRASQANSTATLRAEYARDDALALLRHQLEAGEIDLATFEREVEAVRRQSAA